MCVFLLPRSPRFSTLSPCKPTRMSSPVLLRMTVLGTAQRNSESQRESGVLIVGKLVRVYTARGPAGGRGATHSIVPGQEVLTRELGTHRHIKGVCVLRISCSGLQGGGKYFTSGPQPDTTFH